VYQGQTTGTPICLLIRNQDQRSKDYGEIAQRTGPATPTTPTGASSAFATRAAAGARRRG
jgi:chorismate synthase